MLHDKAATATLHTHTIIIGNCVLIREVADYSATALPTTPKTKTVEVTKHYVYKSL
jgi:hypothetical protein